MSYKKKLLPTDSATLIGVEELDLFPVPNWPYELAPEKYNAKLKLKVLIDNNIIQFPYPKRTSGLHQIKPEIDKKLSLQY